LEESVEGGTGFKDAVPGSGIPEKDAALCIGFDVAGMDEDAGSVWYVEKSGHIPLKAGRKYKLDPIGAGGDAGFTGEVVKPGEFKGPAEVDALDLQLTDGWLDRGDSLAVEVEVG
jgi:hypothetical protein